MVTSTALNWRDCRFDPYLRIHLQETHLRVKVGMKWHEVNRYQPIMIELTEQDKLNIQNMAPEATKYAIFSDDSYFVSVEDKMAWMQ